MKSKVSKYWILSNTTGTVHCLQWGLIWGLWDNTRDRSSQLSPIFPDHPLWPVKTRRVNRSENCLLICPAERTLSIETMSIIVLWLWHWLWHWRRSISFYLSDLWCSQSNYITRHHHWLVTNYIPWGGGRGWGGCLYYPGGPTIPLAGTSNNKHLTAPDKWSSKLEMLHWAQQSKYLHWKEATWARLFSWNSNKCKDLHWTTGWPVWPGI